MGPGHPKSVAFTESVFQERSLQGVSTPKNHVDQLWCREGRSTLTNRGNTPLVSARKTSTLYLLLATCSMAQQKPKPQADSLKQKSLMSWLGQSSSSSNTNTKSAKPPAQNGASNTSINSRLEPKTPESRGRDALTLVSPAAMSSRSSDGGLSALETPPTSDPVDVEMLSAEEEETSRVVSSVMLISSSLFPLYFLRICC
jgi:hypothetical protein